MKHFYLPLFLVLASCQPELKEEVVVNEPEVKWTRTSWPVARGGAGLSGTVGDPILKSPELAWTFKTDGPILGEAMVSGDRVVFGNDLGLLYVLDVKTGDLIWKKEYEDAIEAAPAIHEGTLFIGCQDSFLYALDLATGDEKWKVETDDKITAGVNLTPSPDDTETWVILNGYDGACRALRASDGKEMWIYKTNEYINGTPAIVDGKQIVFGGCDRVLYSLDVATGEANETIETDAEIVSTVATSGTFVAWGNYGNEVLTADIATGKRVWRYTDRRFPFMSAPAIDEKHVFIGCRDKKLHAISRADGSALWQFKTGGRVESSPLLFTDAVLCASTDGRLYALDLEKGEAVWKLDLGEAMVAAPSFANGMIFVGGEDGTLFAVREKREKIE
ncbi:PQQ-binding-like beta-propeller repeat protein [Akkermansiaceae bacterium]|nr:PQQ-binding-like beta-propeller repeat protein [Akkermansiaceae bacterium]